MLSNDDLIRFLSNTSKQDGQEGENPCWLWTGRANNGHAVFWLGDRDYQASRIAWQVFFGQIPPGHNVTRKCGDPLCVNPAHLELTPRGSSRKHRSSIPRGEEHYRAKLTDAQVRFIRGMYATGDITQEELGRLFGVHQVEISAIVRHKVRKQYG